jgi:sialate O-acetylesterase
MVLQQKKAVTFWGKSSPNNIIKVNASWGETNSIISDSKGDWELKLLTPAAGGPHEIEVKSSRKVIKLKDVLVGEVWLASGQSNMQMTLNPCDNCIDNQDEEIKNANYRNLRFFSVLEDLTGESLKNQKWVKTTPKNASKFSAAAYFFARELHQKLDVPIGIISSSWGGTNVKSWISNKKLKTIGSTQDLVPKNIDDDLVKIERLRFNDSIAELNKKELGLITYDLPKPYFLWNEKIVWNFDLWGKFNNLWADLDLDDIEYKKNDFNDSSWNYIPKSIEQDGSKIKNGFFNYIFKADNSSLSTGVVWLRAKILIDDISEDYSLIINNGIDHIDQTFFNEKLVGNTFSIDGNRNYKIPSNLLNKGQNVIAMRITNIGGDGGFKNPVILKNKNTFKKIKFSEFKFKHHGFITNGSSVLIHDYSLNDLTTNYKEIEDKIHRGYVVNSPYGNSISFEEMLKPLIPYTLKGVIWYQGEANVSEYKDYHELFSGMIDDWRERWGYNFPFYYAQITPYNYDDDQCSQELRDVQRLTLQKTTNTGMAVLMDIGEKDNGHPPNKQDVGKRLALLALNRDYNFNLVDSGPLYSNHKLVKESIEISFDHVGSGLMAKGTLDGFEIAGEDDCFFPAKAHIENNKINVYSKEVKTPKNVRYGWENYFDATLFNIEGLPASSFNSLNK